MNTNRIIAAVYDAFLYPSERLGIRARRGRLVSDLHGRILEVSVGTGLNLTEYGPDAEVHAIDPDPHMLARARDRSVAAPARIRLYQADAHDLPFVDSVFDAVVMGFALCTIPDPARALVEARRVVRSDGRLRFLEHVRSSSERTARWQDLLAPAWERIAGGCRLNQPTVGIIEGAGWRVDGLWPSSGGSVVSGQATPCGETDLSSVERDPSCGV